MLFIQVTITLSKKTNCASFIGLSSIHKFKQRLRCFSCLVHLQRCNKNIVGWHQAILENPCCIGVRGCARGLNMNICVNPLNKTL